MDAHTIHQPIRSIEIDTIPEVQGGFEVGRNGVTEIEACTKPGLHCDIPYVRVWKGQVCAAEFCQHGIVGIYFDPFPEPRQQSAEEIARLREMHTRNIVNGSCTSCDRPDDDCECLPF